MAKAPFILALAVVPALLAQEAVKCGAGSFASHEPTRLAKYQGHPGDKSLFMQTRPVHMTGRNTGKPIPTNDWWTDALVSQWTGNLWSYPAKVRIGENGVRVAFPKHWNDDGTELRERSALRVFAASTRPFLPDAALVDDWHDWDIEIELRERGTEDGERIVKTTLVHGSPFTWVESRGVDLFVVADAGEDSPLVEQRSQPDGGEIFAIGDDLYGVWRGKTDGGSWIAIGLLPDEAAYATLSPYATAIIRETRVDWRYDQAKAEVSTVWRVKTEDLRRGNGDEGAGKSVGPVALQGFLPHHLKKTRLGFKCLDKLVWQTPRGQQRVAAGNALEITYPFPGMLPYWAITASFREQPPAPSTTGSEPPSATSPSATGSEPPPAPPPSCREMTSSRGLFRDLLADYAERGTFGGDTYWGGKGLLQMTFAMMAARELGETAIFEKARARLRERFEDWLTYTPGEERHFFAYVPRWGGLVGISPSYDSETFNDHHFHYGYFTYAGALLCLADADFAQKYGPMLRLVAKDYANWERGDTHFPFLRTFDPWAGHSFAGGMGDGNGNGQESSSEAMQGWGGLYLLGIALGDNAMRDVGIFGYAMGSRTVAEYWFDRDRENIDRSRYKHPYCCNLTCHGVGWWTFFTGDPAWMHAIQWLPDTPALDYLSEDLAFAKWDWEEMWAHKEIGGWFEKGRDKAGNETPCVGDASLGNVFLSYLRRHDPAQAAEVFDRLREKGLGAAVNPDTAHMAYWAIHSSLDFGAPDFSVRADHPCARAFVKDGRRTLMAYNDGTTPRIVTFFDKDWKSVGSLLAAPGRLTVEGTPVELRADPILRTAPPPVKLRDDLISQKVPSPAPSAPPEAEPQDEPALLDLDF
ncbi:MAG: hypothetical protein IJT64_01705 [Kiritimatiellae bacterium]|nr:hypothetical protein [Kiritimatiellia bacterium]